MQCPFCFNTESIIIHTQKYSSTIRRVRACQQCGMAWRTYEEAPVCRDCGHRDSDVTNTEKFQETIKRTRRCPVCPLVWKTYEIVYDNHNVVDFKPYIIDEEVFKRSRKPEYVTHSETQLGLFI